ncbi:MAG: hypothetical protein ACRDPY_34300 [Streptosporangiaceae bacterium]
MTPERWNDRDAERRARTRKALRQVWWALIPVWSIGFLSFAPFLAYALIQRRRKDWAVFAAYLAATVAIFVALGAVNPSSGAGAAVGGFIVALAGCAAVHAAVLFRPSRAVAPLGPAMPLGPRQRNQQALAAARDRIERRKEARQLLARDPGLAREMRIGRPDLQRDYDDGGLIDVNHVPPAVLAAKLGLAQGEVTDVLAARDKLGRFASADELCAYTELRPDRVDELRDLMIFA